MFCTRKERVKEGLIRRRRALILFALSFLLFSLFMAKAIKDINAKPIGQDTETSLKDYGEAEPPYEVEEETLSSDKEDNNIPPDSQGEAPPERSEESSPIGEPDNTSVHVEDAFSKDGKKTAYLTFDDGPSRNITPKVLDILKQYDIRATFFVIGSMAEENEELLKRTAKEGHAIGNHTYSHKYKKIYSSVDSLLEEVDKSSEVLSKILGESYKTSIFRFPGGSWGKKYLPFKEALKEQGYEYVEWNALTGDAEGYHIPKDKLLDRLVKTVGDEEDVVILMHDAGSKKTTVEVLPEAIEYLKSQGYTFKTLK